MSALSLSVSLKFLFFSARFSLSHESSYAACSYSAYDNYWIRSLRRPRVFRSACHAVCCRWWGWRNTSATTSCPLIMIRRLCGVQVGSSRHTHTHTHTPCPFISTHSLDQGFSRRSNNVCPAIYCRRRRSRRCIRRFSGGFWADFLRQLPIRSVPPPPHCHMNPSQIPFLSLVLFISVSWLVADSQS